MLKIFYLEIGRIDINKQKLVRKNNIHKKNKIIVLKNLNNIIQDYAILQNKNYV